MTRRWILAILAGLLLFPGIASAAFNEIITGARPAGMGGAFVGLSDDVNALYWNPGGLTLQKCPEAGFMHANELTPTNGPAIVTDFAAGTSGNTPYGAAGIAYLGQGLSDILQERTLSASYAYAFNPFTRIGLTMKSMALVTKPVGNFYPDPALTNQSTVGFDVGLLHIVTPDLRFGFLARNVGAKLGVVERENVDVNYRLGLAYKFHTELIDEDYLWLTFDLFTRQDVDDTAGTSFKSAVGLEWQLTPWVALRAGVDRGRIAGGVGLCALGLSVDYAAEENPEGTGVAQRISITYRFGEPQAPPEPPPKAAAVYSAPPKFEAPPRKARRGPEG